MNTTTLVIDDRNKVMGGECERASVFYQDAFQATKTRYTRLSFVVGGMPGKTLPLVEIEGL